MWSGCHRDNQIRWRGFLLLFECVRPGDVREDPVHGLLWHAVPADRATKRYKCDEHNDGRSRVPGQERVDCTVRVVWEAIVAVSASAAVMAVSRTLLLLLHQ